MRLVIVICMLEPDPSRPQLGLHSMYDACHCVRLLQQPHLTKQILIYSAACHQGQHLASYPKGLHSNSVVTPHARNCSQRRAVAFAVWTWLLLTACHASHMHILSWTCSWPGHYPGPCETMAREAAGLLLTQAEDAQDHGVMGCTLYR